MSQATDNKLVSSICSIATLRGLFEVTRADTLAIEKEAEGLLDGLLMQGTPA